MYELSHGVGLGPDLRRVIVEELTAAIMALEDPQREEHNGIHNARKSIKKLRAALRLVRRPLGKAGRAANGRLRDTARLLAGARDAEVLIETYDRLRKQFPELKGQSFAAIRRGLVKRQREASDASLEQHAAQAIEDLSVLREEAQGWPLDREGFGLVEEGLAQFYRDGRSAMRLVLEHSDDFHYHEWRKRVKDHWYHMRLLRPAWPAVLDGYVEALDKLSELLGKHNDLAVLRERLGADELLREAPDAANQLATFAEQAQQHLRAQVLPLGARVYAERASELAHRCGGYWSAWTAAPPTPLH